MSKSLSPRDAAEKLGISADTLRRWERNGLIQSDRTPGGQRRYSEEDLSTLLERGPAAQSRAGDREQIASFVPLADDPREQSHPATTASQLAPWERRIREEQADLDVAKIRREHAALLHADREEREKRERAAAEAGRASAARAAQEEREAQYEAAQEKRLSDLREYGRTCGVWAPAEYQAKVVRDLLSSVTLESYPPDLSDYLARVQVNARVERILKRWKDEEANQRAERESEQRLKSLILSGKWYAWTETRSWDRPAADRASREVERALREEVDAEWTEDDVRDLVDDVLDEWDEG